MTWGRCHEQAARTRKNKFLYWALRQHKVFAGCLGGMNTKLPAQCLTRLRIKTYLTLPSKMERKSKFFVLGILECPNSASKHIWSGTFPHLGSLPLLSLLIPQPLYWLISSILSHCDQIHMENWAIASIWKNLRSTFHQASARLRIISKPGDYASRMSATLFQRLENQWIGYELPAPPFRWMCSLTLFLSEHFRRVSSTQVCSLYWMVIFMSLGTNSRILFFVINTSWNLLQSNLKHYWLVSMTYVVTDRPKNGLALFWLTRHT